MGMKGKDMTKTMDALWEAKTRCEEVGRNKFYHTTSGGLAVASSCIYPYGERVQSGLAKKGVARGGQQDKPRPRRSD